MLGFIQLKIPFSKTAELANPFYKIDLYSIPRTPTPCPAVANPKPIF